MLRVILFFCLAFAQFSPAAWAASRKEIKPGSAIQPNEGYRFEDQLGRVDHRVIKLVGEEKQKFLRHMAEATVLSDFCPMVQVDSDRFQKDFDSLATSSTPRKPADQRDLENKLMTYFGVYVGLLVAEGTENDMEFCELASKIQKNQGPVSRYWVAPGSKQAPVATPSTPAAKQ